MTITASIDRLLGETTGMNTSSMHELHYIVEQLKLIKLHQSSQISKEDLDSTNLSLQKYISKGLQLMQNLEILKSLRYDTMPARYSAVSHAHARTFSWIFHPMNLPRSDPRSQIKFLNWLHHGDGIFWISGKPGSGKSTLMKYLYGNEQTDSALVQWAKPFRLVQAHFFFWNAGTTMEKSLNGLFQSLLYEVLLECPHLTPILCASRWSEDWNFNARSSKPWCLPELSLAFNRLKDQRVPDIKFCFFIDGLDEYDGDHLELIEVLENVGVCQDIKLCISSRPWNCFERAFGASFDRKLYLQDLTKMDITIFTKEKLGPYVRQAMKKSESRDYQEIIYEIVDRAQGVFLWVVLVVRSLRDGFVNRDSIATLKKRLRSLPTDLEPFFKHILNSVDKIYQQQLAQTFQVALDADRPLPLILYSFIHEEDVDLVAQMPYMTMPFSEIHRRCEEMICRLNALTKGLLEASFSGHDVIDAPNRTEHTVDFLHRTVRDFLMTREMADLLRSNFINGFSASLTIAKAQLAFIKADLYSPVDIGRRIVDIGDLARIAELQTGSSDIGFLDELEKAGQLRARRFLNDDDCFYKFAVERDLIKYLDQKTKRLGRLRTKPEPLLEIALEDAFSTTEDVKDTKMVNMLLEHGYDANQRSSSCTVFSNFIRSCPRNFAKDHQLYLKQLELLLAHGADAQVGGWALIDVIWTLDGKGNSHAEQGCIIPTLESLLAHGMDPNKLRQPGSSPSHISIWSKFLLLALRQNSRLGADVIIRGLTAFVHNRADLDLVHERVLETGITESMPAKDTIIRFVDTLDGPEEVKDDKESLWRALAESGVCNPKFRARDEQPQHLRQDLSEESTIVRQTLPPVDTCVAENTTSNLSPQVRRKSLPPKQPSYSPLSPPKSYPTTQRDPYAHTIPGVPANSSHCHYNARPRHCIPQSLHSIKPSNVEFANHRSPVRSVFASQHFPEPSPDTSQHITTEAIHVTRHQIKRKSRQENLTSAYLRS